MIKRVHALRLSEEIVNILLDIEAVHEDEGGRLILLEQFLLERVAILSVVDNDFAIGSANQPFVVGLQEADIEAVQRRVHACQVLNRDGQRSPRLNMDEEDLSVLCRAEQVLAARQDSNRDYVVQKIIAVFRGRIGLFIRRVNQTATQASRVLQIKESDVTICEGTNHVRFELVHGD